MSLGEWILIMITGILIAVILFFYIKTKSITHDVETLENSFEENEKLLEEIDEYNKLLNEYKKDFSKESVNKFETEKYLYDTKDYTDNILLNNVLSYKLNQARSLGIDVRVDSDYDLKWNMNENDTVALIFNLMDNAIEAAKQCKKSFIYLTIRVDNAIILKIENSKIQNKITVSNVEKDNRENAVAANIIQGETSKKDTRADGFGLDIIRTLADKYNGKLIFRDNGSEFCSELHLGLTHGVSGG